MSNGIHEQEIVIRPPSGLPKVNLRELYEYRHMLGSMIWKKIRVEFNDMYLNVFWACVRPLAMLAVFHFIKNYSGANMYVSIPYSLYFYSGIIFWFYFVEATSTTAKSVERDAGLMQKIYFPRLISPLVPIVSGLYTLAIAAVPLLVMMLWNGVYPGWKILLLPLVLLTGMVLILGIGAMFASLTIFSRDSERFLKIILYLGLFVSPIMYQPDKIEARGQIIYFLNPMAGILLAFRACLFSDFPLPAWWQIQYSVCFSIIILFVGLRMFHRAEMYFMDKL